MITNVLLTNTSTKAKQLAVASVIASTLMISQNANAGLIARTITDATFGTVQAYYDDVLDLTWLKDANFAKTSGYDADGKMTWAAANTWAGQLSLGAYDDWRLTSLQPQNSQTEFDYNWSYDGSSDRGYNITSTVNEMAYMFHVNLGLEGICDGASNTASSCDQSGSGFHDTAWDTTIDTASLGNNIAIDNLMSYLYWSDLEYAPHTGNAWAFHTYNGYQNSLNKLNSLYGWAV
ncbi:MAG: hypothetical protein JKX67_03525, partial [Colwellia sp.]|nr:hypothetical protein [Colwellia sp.]